jgi:hypothetical protein
MRFLLRGDAEFVVGMAVVALAAGLSLAFGPTYALAGVALFLIVMWPSTGIAVAICIESCKLVPTLLGLSSANLSLVATAALMAAAASRTARFPLNGRRFLVVSGLLVAIAGPGLLIGFAQSAPLHMVSTLNLLVAPFAAFAAARYCSPRTHRHMLRFAILLLTANAAACAWQVSTGVGGLVAQGLNYGTTVRQIDGVLRTPGLTMTSATAGLFAGAVLMWLIVGLRNPAARVGRLWTALGIASGATVLVLSTSRSGAILAVVTALTVAIVWLPSATLETGRPRNAVFAGRTLIVLGVLAIPVALTQYGANSSDSLFDRTVVWEGLLSGNVSMFGIGAGSVGASSYSEYNPRGGVFVDNSWLSLLLQYGLVGAIGTMLLLVVSLVRLAKISKWAPRESGASAAVVAVLVAISVTALFVEILDYAIVMMIVGCILSHNRILTKSASEEAVRGMDVSLNSNFSTI